MLSHSLSRFVTVTGLLYLERSTHERKAVLIGHNSLDSWAKTTVPTKPCIKDIKIVENLEKVYHQICVVYDSVWIGISYTSYLQYETISKVI